MRASEKHRFYWFSDMNKNEAILLKIFDSTPRESGIARLVRHPVESVDPMGRVENSKEVRFGRPTTFAGGGRGGVLFLF